MEDLKSHEPTMEAVLIIDDLPQTLATARALDQAGFEVYVASDTRPIAGYSRSVKSCFKLDSSPDQTDLSSLTRNLNTILEEHPQIVCLLPIGEQSIANVQACLPDLERAVAVASVSQDILNLCIDKNVTNRAAEAAGVLVPTSRLAHNHAELTQAVEDVGFPLILKSPDNTAPVCGNKAQIIEDYDTFRHLLPTWPPEHTELLVQQYISGVVAGCDFVALDGDIVCYYQGNLQRTDRLDGTGMGVDFSSLEPEPKLFEALQKFVGHTGYTGPGLLQCIHCDSTTRMYFVEINPRLSAGIADPLNAGANLPAAAVQAALGRLTDTLNSSSDAKFRYPIRSFWLERDLRGWLNQRHVLTPEQSRKWLGQMFRSMITCDAHINWRWYDPAPSFKIFYRLFRAQLANYLKRRSTSAGVQSSPKTIT